MKDEHAPYEYKLLKYYVDCLFSNIHFSNQIKFLWQLSFKDMHLIYDSEYI